MNEPETANQLIQEANKLIEIRDEIQGLIDYKLEQAKNILDKAKQ